MKTSETISEIAKALVKMQGSMTPAKKGSINPFFKSSYADLVSIWAAIRDPLMEHGLCVVQNAQTLDEGVSVSTRIIHTSGEFMEFGPLVMPVSKKDAQAVGSAISYAKRYSLGAALGIVAEKDDDGNKAVKSAPNPKFDYEKTKSKWDKKYGKENIDGFLTARSEHYGLEIEAMVKDLSANEVGFQREIDAWISKHLE